MVSCGFEDVAVDAALLRGLDPEASGVDESARQPVALISDNVARDALMVRMAPEACSAGVTEGAEVRILPRGALAEGLGRFAGVAEWAIGLRTSPVAGILFAGAPATDKRLTPSVNVFSASLPASATFLSPVPLVTEGALVEGPALRALSDLTAASALSFPAAPPSDSASSPSASLSGPAALTGTCAPSLVNVRLTRAEVAGTAAGRARLAGARRTARSGLCGASRGAMSPRRPPR